MAGEWHKLRLGNVCPKIGSGATPRGGSNVYLDRGDVTLIRSQNIYNDGFHRDGLVYLTEKNATELANVEVEENDVFLNITGDSVARACQVVSDVLPARVNQHVAIIRPDPNVLTPRFLRYYLVSPSMQAEMLGLAAVGATRNALTKGMIESFEIHAPVDIDEQRVIAYILGTFDDKIELNHRMNETLEAIARAIFKSWFVDFDPVRAKASGEPPESICRRLGLTPEHLDLFPDRLVDFELGEIPEGWQMARVDDVAEKIFSGGTPDTRKSEYWNGDINWFSSGETRNSFVVKTEKKIAQLAVDNSSTKLALPGDIFVASAGQGNTRGQTSYCAINTYINQSVVSIRANRAVMHPLWLYFNLSARYEEMRSISDSHSSRGSLTTKLLGGMALVVPNLKLVNAYGEMANSLTKLLISNARQNDVLGEIRDALLPMLLSGEIVVASVQS